MLHDATDRVTAGRQRLPTSYKSWILIPLSFIISQGKNPFYIELRRVASIKMKSRSD